MDPDATLGLAEARAAIDEMKTILMRDFATLADYAERDELPPVEHAFSRFHVRWYPVTMVFLAFDMEMLFMYPWTLVVSRVGAAAVIEMFLFLAILLAGVLYAWREGALRWT